MVKSGKDLYSLRVSLSGENYRQIKWWNVRVTPKQSSASKRVIDRGGTGSVPTPSIGMSVYLWQRTLSINALPPPSSTQMRWRLYGVVKTLVFSFFLSCVQSCVILPLHIQQPSLAICMRGQVAPKNLFIHFLPATQVMQEGRKIYVLIFGMQ